MSTTRTTTCPFCLNGCTSGVSFDGYQYRMDYAVDAHVNRGRLCPRGNSASIVVDHPKRLSYPLLDGRETTWQQAGELVRRWLRAAGAGGLAIVYSRGRAADEVRRLHGLARELGTPYLACGHVEPENAFNHRLAGVEDATLEDVQSAKATLLVGDVFNTSPVASWRMLEARYADRKNRLVVVDSLRTRQSGFAHVFVQVRPGTEPFALLALAALLDRKLSGVDVDRHAALAGVERGLLETAAKALEPKTPGFVGSAMHPGRVRHPALHSLASQLVARAAKKPFTGFRETALPFGPTGFSSLREAVAAGKVKMLFWTGGLYPGSYHELMPELDKVEHRVATAIFVPDPPIPGLVLPLTAELERSSVGGSYWGEVKRSPVASPFSGSRGFADVLGLLGRAEEADVAAPKPESVEAVVAMAAGAVAAERASDGWLLVGEKKAIGIRGFFDDEETILVNAADAGRLEVDDEDYVAVKGPVAEAAFQVHVSRQVPPGVLCVGTNVHRNRALFPLGVDPATGETVVGPVRVEVEKAGVKVGPASETRAV